MKLAKTLRLFAFLLSALIALDSVAQSSVSGTVKDAIGETIPGASVRVKGHDSYAAVTDIDGNFLLKVPNLNSTLTVSYVGYKTQEVALNGRTMVEITLVEDSQMLEEVVAIGYGTAKKEIGRAHV